ncbi:MAG: ABC transporter permease, partial [Clostridia bacterium]
SRVNSILSETGVDPENSGDGMTGSWNLDIMLGSSLHIERDMNRILHNHGYQSDSASSGDNYIGIGVNWGYSGSQLADSIDPGLVAAIIALLLLILFTGYLIIYNVFQISVSNDIRFYGLLKTIGTTPKQLRKIIRHQALLLSLIGIPLGLIGGWIIGAKLTPVIVSQFRGIVSTISVSPVIFTGAALFSLLTVFLSCACPGRIASKVSPIEAVRYTENGTIRKKKRKAPKKDSILSMAKANLGRNRSKTVITIVSLALSVVLLNATVTFTNGFDMDKYLSNFVATDFVVADTAHFQRNGALQIFDTDNALPEEIIDTVNEQGGITEGGAVYGKVSPVQKFVTEDYFRSHYGRWERKDALEWLVDSAERNEAGLLADDAQLYGMGSFALDQLKVVEGDLTALYEPGTDAIAAVCDLDDYGNPMPDSYWAEIGDTVTLRYAEAFEYYNPDTGEIYADGIPENAHYSARAVRYRDVSYTVAAVVSVPNAISYQYYGDDTFVLNDQIFIRDTGTNSILLYAFNTTDEANEAMEEFLADYTENQNPSCDYDSKAKYQSEFESFRSLFLLMGSALSFIIGLVGILNFFNVILTGIISRKREFAVLQSIGMTGRQLKKMLMYEGLIYTMGSLIFALTLTVLLSPAESQASATLFEKKTSAGV